MIYYVVSWETDRAINSTENLEEAKRLCRKMGHGPKDALCTSYPPLAFVAVKIMLYNHEAWGCVYNPRFK